MMTSRKKYHCCFPGCITYDSLENFIPLPHDSFWREQWLLTIPRKDWVVSANTIACKKHFPKPTNFCTKSINQIKKKKLTVLNIKSAPSVLLNTKTIQLVTTHKPSHMFELYHRDIEEPEDLDGMASNVTDFIGTYFYLKILHPKRLEMFLDNPWKVDMNLEYTIFYTVDFCEIPRIRASIKVDKNLIASVTLSGKTVDPLDLTWILPINGRLKRWSQLHMMLAIFGR